MISSVLHRVVITGLGVVAPNGIGRKAFWDGLMAGRNSIGRVTRFPVEGLASHVGAEVKDFQPDARVPVTYLPLMDRATQFGVNAAFEAVDDAGLHFDQENTERVGVFMGFAVAGVDSTESEFHSMRNKPLNDIKINPYHTWMPSGCSAFISMLLGLHGQSQVISTGCTSSTDAMGMALEAIRSGEEDIALAGGSEAPLTPLVYSAFCAMRALSTRNSDPTHASRPFDKERDGFVLGEGAAVLVLESYEHAVARGATIYAEFAGFATTSNAFHMTAPEPTAAQASRAFSLALEDAQIDRDDVDYICAHGSSTPLNERAETAAFKKTFGSRSYQIPVSSIKSMIGHPLGSAGALQAVSCALAIRQGAVPPTINYEFPDPDCDLDNVPNIARDWPVKVAATNSAGFSGKNTVTLLRAL